MILHDDRQTTGGGSSHAMLDGLFRQAAMRHERAIALSDPPDRHRITSGLPHRLTYAEADNSVSAAAARLRELGLQTDAIVAMQLPNTAEAIITLLGILRAGMIAALLPLLWRKADIVRALSRINAKALITCSRIGTTAHGEVAMQVAAELFSIRHVCIFGDAPDGTVPLDDVFASAKIKTAPPVTRSGNPADHIAVITFDVAADGIVPVARSHTQLIAGGLGPVLEGCIEADATILTTTPIGSFAGVALSVMPWLLSGGTLALHHPFDLDSFSAQQRAFHCDAMVLPAALLAPLADAGYLAGCHIKTILALRRGPERLADAIPTNETSLVDVVTFGESGLIATLREPHDGPLPLPVGKISAPRGHSGAVPIVEVARSKDGTLMLRGPMIPQSAFPPGAEQRHEPHLNIRPDRFVDTGYGCILASHGQSVTTTSPPAGIVGVGGYRFVMHGIEAIATKAVPNASVFAVPHAVLGQRLVGSSADRAAAAVSLNDHGENPLVADAFRPRGSSAAA
ncbi:MAG TPA: class I adenylate-forming enzyme family protein [Pseudolabrys sp.]|nr:class I adenylate-forming enzyme family protein [Pseudolabrys sp.]